MKKLITFLFDYTLIGWVVMTVAAVIAIGILLSPYADEIKVFIHNNIDYVFPTFIICISIYTAYIFIVKEWKEFSKTYKS